VSEELTIAEAASRLGISPSAVRKRISRGLLSARKNRGQWYVVLSEAETGQDKAEQEKDKEDRQDKRTPDVRGQESNGTGQSRKQEREQDKQEKDKAELSARIAVLEAERNGLIRVVSELERRIDDLEEDRER